MLIKIIAKNEKETKKTGEMLAKEILKSGQGKKPFLISLKGNLGAGKTTFLKGFARGLKIKEKILSPTFVIVKRFQIKGGCFKNFYHFDCYRLEKKKEILKLNFRKIIKNPFNIIVVEWGEKIKEFLPAETIWIVFKIKNQKEREIIIKK